MQSAVVIYALGHPVNAWMDDNAALARYIAGGAEGPSCILAIETVQNYGMAVGQTTFDTLIWIGRFVQAWPHGEVLLVKYPDIALHLCGTHRAKDANIRAALWNRFGGTRQAAVGTKRAPGPCYGLKEHMWSALAVAVYTQEVLLKKGDAT